MGLAVLRWARKSLVVPRIRACGLASRSADLLRTPISSRARKRFRDAGHYRSACDTPCVWIC